LGIFFIYYLISRIHDGVMRLILLVLTIRYHRDDYYNLFSLSKFQSLLFIYTENFRIYIIFVIIVILYNLVFYVNLRCVIRFILLFY